jgi:hypothetical protein
MHTCKTCLFFDPAPQTQAPKAINGAVNMGACRLKPPVTMIVGMQQTLSGQPTPAFAAIWPTVSEAEFCSEHPENKRDAQLQYDARVGEFNRTPTATEIEAMAQGRGPIKVARTLDPKESGTPEQ